MKKIKSLIVALDVKTPAQAKSLVKKAGKAVDFYKVAPSLYFQDPTIIRWLRKNGKKVFLDFKWYDIPSQMRRSVEMAGRMGVTSCTVHASAGEAALKEVMSIPKKDRPLVWGVSVLTSFGDKDLRGIGVKNKVAAQVKTLAALAQKTKLDGMVCSPQELSWLRKQVSFSLVTPGIQWGGSVSQDQKRMATPRAAWKGGSDFIVVGRAILQAKNPAEAAKQILKERS